MQPNYPTVDICAINRTNNTMICDNLYQDNTGMTQFFSQQILFCIDAYLFPCLHHMRNLKVLGSKPNLHFPAYGVLIDCLTLSWSTLRLMAANVFAPH